MVLTLTRQRVHQHARDVATLCWHKTGEIPELLYDIFKATASDEALLKYNPNHDPVNGRFTSGPGGGDGNAGSSGKKDPGAVPAKRNDGTTVVNPKTGQPLLMPKGVSLSDNAKIGQDMKSLPSAFSGSVHSRDKEKAISSQVGTNMPMDYQRLYDNGQFNKTYTDFGNYNYGVVAAAAGYNLDEAMIGAGFHNVSVHNSDQSGYYWTDASENTFIPMGYQDYTSGRIIPKN